MKKILIIEDDESIRDIVSSYLSQKGYDILEAENGVTALRIIKDCLPDLIVSDIMMPEMDGYDLLTKIRENPLTNHIPVIFLTAISTPASRRLSKELGVNEHIIKPFHPNSLIESIKLHLNKK